MKMPKKTTQPDMTIVLIVPDNYGTISKVIQYLRAQTVRDQLEILIVGSSKQRMRANEEELTAFQHVQVLELGEFELSAKARAAGVHAASSALVSFLEDHTFPAPDWAEHMINEHQNGWAGVGPEMLNANPASMTSWANLILAFGSWMGSQKKGVRKRIPPHNSSYKRDILLTYGDDLDTWLDTEGLMQDDLRSRGYQFYIQPNAKIKHLNISKLDSFIREQYYGGRMFAAAAFKSWSFVRRLLYILGSPLIPLRRLPQLLDMITRADLSKQLVPSVLPALLLGLIVHSFGEMMGYVFGPGQAKEKSTELEFHHYRHLSSRDQNWETHQVRR